MLYGTTTYYLIISSLFLLFLSFYWLGFFFIFLCNFIRWKNICRSEKSLFYLNKNEIINDEFTSEIWWIRAEFNVLDLYGIVLKDFDTLINYSNLLFYYNFFDHGLFVNTHLYLFNNSYSSIFFTRTSSKLKKNKIIHKVKLNLKDQSILKNKTNTNIVFKKKYLTLYLMNNYKLIIYLSNSNFYNNQYNHSYILFNHNYYSLKYL